MLNPEISVREANASDQAEVARVGTAAEAILRKVYRIKPGAASTLPPADQISRLVATISGQVVGTLRFFRADDRLHLVGVMVDPAFHRRGVSRALVEMARVIAVGKGLGKLSLYTIRQTGNVPIFERLGFSVVREEPDQFGEGVDGRELTECLMESASPHP